MEVKPAYDASWRETLTKAWNWFFDSYVFKVFGVEIFEIDDTLNLEFLHAAIAR